MKEVCIINYGSSAAVYGIGTYIKEYVQCLLNIGCKVCLIELGTDCKTPDIYIKEENGIRIIHIPYLRDRDFTNYNKSVCRLLRLYLEDSQDLVFHFHYLQSDSLQVDLKRYFPLSKSILTVHYLYWSAKFNGNLPVYENIIRRKNYVTTKRKYRDVIDNYEKEKTFIQSVDQVICLTEDTYELLKRLYEADVAKLSMIPNGLRSRRKIVSAEERNELRRQYYIADTEKIILFVGRINPIKGISPLLAAFEKVLNEYPACRLVIIGDGDFTGVMKQLRNTVTKIIFTGRLDKKKLYQWYQIADLAVFPSYYEECSYVGIEMLMHGLPIVASDGYAVRNMFDNHNAVIAAVGDWGKTDGFSQRLFDATLLLLHSDYLLAEKKYQSLRVYKGKYQLKWMQQKYFDLLFAL